MWTKKGNSYFNIVLLKDGTAKALETTIKNSGKERNIYILCPESKKFLQTLIPYLNNVYYKHHISDCCHGFLPNRSPVTNAKMHIGYELSICFDIKNFFESINPNIVKKFLPKKIIDACFISGSLPQGFPTSPIISNIAMIEIDEYIENNLKEYFLRLGITDYVYTRYADDLTISINYNNYSSMIGPKNNFKILNTKENKKIYKDIFIEINKIIESVINAYSLTLNKKKSKLQPSYCGNRIITGVSVTRLSIKPTRKVKRKLRAAIHQNNLESMMGIYNWISHCDNENKW